MSANITVTKSIWSFFYLFIFAQWIKQINLKDVFKNWIDFVEVKGSLNGKYIVKSFMDFLYWRYNSLVQRSICIDNN
jgi:hypothetical protein